MTQLTITEALAEIKTIDKRLAKKQEFVVSNLARDEKMRDPLERDGGSEKLVSEGDQAIRDLNDRKVAIRLAIQSSNMHTDLTVQGETRLIAAWLIWRREVADWMTTHLNHQTRALNSFRVQVKRAVGRGVPDDETSSGIIAHLSEADLAARSENLETILGDLDGQLSLKNATTIIEI